VLQSNNVVAEALAVSLDKPLEWAVGFFFDNVELSMELWTVICGHIGIRRLRVDDTFPRMSYLRVQKKGHDS